MLAVRPAARPRRRGPSRFAPLAAFVGAALAFVGVTFAAGAPSPLFVLYQQEWGFPAWVLTVAFAIYAITLLVTLLIAGSLSDHIGRRPVLIGALALEVVSMLLFLFAQDIGWIIVRPRRPGRRDRSRDRHLHRRDRRARSREAQEARRRHRQHRTRRRHRARCPPHRPRRAVHRRSRPSWSSSPWRCVFTAGILVIVASPETVVRRPGAVRSLIPRLIVPRAARARVRRCAPAASSATWMLAGLFIGLRRRSCTASSTSTAGW